MKFKMILIPLFLPILLYGQSKVLISNAGSSIQNGRISESIGQVFTHAKKDNSFFLSEGFQQADYNKDGIKMHNLFTQIHPNPTTSKVHVSSSEEIDEARLLDINGRVIYTIENVNSQYLNFSLESYVQGMYLLKITTESGMSSIQKIIRN